MSRQRFELALERLRSTEGERFEQLASAFLVDEFPNLRTMANPSGDGGRDGALWGVDGEEELVFQYSVSKDWAAKVRKTVKRVGETFPGTAELVYVTNQVIGSQADELRGELRKKHKIRLDVRDGNWFLDRQYTTLAREAAAESLITAVADPYLASRGVFENKALALDSLESRAALVHLNLQWENDARDKGLTKLSFEALVRSVLRDTSSEQRLARGAVHQRVADLLPGHEADVVVRLVDAALLRLTKKFIRHWAKEDEFCLTHKEKVRITDKLAQLEQADLALGNELLEVLRRWYMAGGLKEPEMAATLQLRETIDRYFLSRGEAFAATVARGQTEQADDGPIRQAVAGTLGATHDDAQSRALTGAAQEVLVHPSARIHAYLRSVADAYTLLAFLRETPDVQSAVVKMFSGGEVWLDTSMLLPLFADELLDEDERVYSAMISAALASGMTMCATDGVIEEVSAHMTRCIAAARSGIQPHTRRTPYLLAAFTLAGRAPGSFPSWIEVFRGDARPQDDVAAYLAEAFGIVRANLDEAEHAPDALRYAVQRLWSEVHERRRSTGRASDSDTINRLTSHDVENYLGVIVRRKGRQRDSPLGYRSWWVTLDGFAYGLRSLLKAELPSADVPDSPVMSPDFLVSYLAIGPMRGKLSKLAEAKLPLAVSEMASLDLLPGELLTLAQAEREKMGGMPERVIQRRVRDALDSRRRALGPVAEGGMEQLAERVAGRRD